MLLYTRNHIDTFLSAVSYILFDSYEGKSVVDNHSHDGLYLIFPYPAYYTCSKLREWVLGQLARSKKDLFYDLNFQLFCYLMYNIYVEINSAISCDKFKDYPT